MKSISIRDKYYRQLELLIEVSGKSRTRILNEIMVAGLVEVGNRVLNSKELEEIDNEKKIQNSKSS